MIIDISYDIYLISLKVIIFIFIYINIIRINGLVSQKF